jgi:hypothetical protein
MDQQIPSGEQHYSVNVFCDEWITDGFKQIIYNSNQVVCRHEHNFTVDEEYAVDRTFNRTDIFLERIKLTNTHFYFVNEMHS